MIKPPPFIGERKTVPLQTVEFSTVESFLSAIGRGASAHSSKFQSWEHLFCCSSKEMKESGIPTVMRKYILRWTENYRLGLPIVEHPLTQKQIRRKKFPLYTEAK